MYAVLYAIFATPKFNFEQSSKKIQSEWSCKELMQVELAWIKHNNKYTLERLTVFAFSLPTPPLIFFALCLMFAVDILKALCDSLSLSFSQGNFHVLFMILQWIHVWLYKGKCAKQIFVCENLCNIAFAVRLIVHSWGTKFCCY